jgi:hypothetical protein
MSEEVIKSPKDFFGGINMNIVNLSEYFTQYGLYILSMYIQHQRTRLFSVVDIWNNERFIETIQNTTQRIEHIGLNGSSFFLKTMRCKIKEKDIIMILEGNCLFIVEEKMENNVFMCRLYTNNSSLYFSNGHFYPLVGIILGEYSDIEQLHWLKR